MEMWFIWLNATAHQCRHQKVVEEAPAPGITEEARCDIGSRCAMLVEIGYRGAWNL